MLDETRHGAARLIRAGAVALLVVLAVGSAANAQEPAEGEAATLGLEVVVGHDGRSAMSQWQPVEVRLEPLRPVQGTLTVRSDSPLSGPSAIARDIEVAAASAVAYRFVVPAGRISVTFQEEGRDAVTVRAPDSMGVTGFLVGVLGGRPATVPPVRSEPTGQSAEWVGLDPAWLVVSPAAVEPLGTVVASQSALEALPETDRRNLGVAVAGGTDLVVAVDRAGRVDLSALGFDDPLGVTAEPVRLRGPELAGGGTYGLETASPAWTLTADELAAGAGSAVVAVAAPAGLGRVVVVGAEPGNAGLGMSSSLWSSAVGPPESTTINVDYSWNPLHDPQRFPALLADDETSVPTVPWLAGFIVAYVVVVGPVSAFVLSRLGRRELAWVAVPIVTAIFTAAAFGGAVTGRPTVGIVGRVAVWSEGVGSETLLAGLRMPTPGIGTAVFDGSGWTVRSLADRGLGATAEQGADLVVSVDLDALQFAGVVASRPLTAEAPLTIEAEASPEGVTRVTVTNRGQRRLSDVRVHAATHQARLGDLDVGQEQTTVVHPSDLRQVDPWGGGFFPEGGGMGMGGEQVGLSGVLYGGVVDGSPGMVWAVASSAASVEDVRVGDEAEDRGTVYAVGTRIGGQSASSSPFAVSRELVARPGGFQPGPLAVEGEGEAVLRFRLPPGGPFENLRSDLRRGPQLGNEQTLAVWDHTARQWVEHDDAFDEGTASQDRFVSRLGEVYVRASGQLWPFDFSARTVVAAEGGRR